MRYFIFLMTFSATCHAFFGKTIYLCNHEKTKGCPNGLRSYPTNLIRLVPAKGLLQTISRSFLPNGTSLCAYLTLKSGIMVITVNNKETELSQGSTIADLAKQLQLPEKGIALAVHNRIIPRAQWTEQTLQPNDSIVIIKAACGG